MRLGLHGSCEVVILTYGYAILAAWSGPLSLVSGGAHTSAPPGSPLGLVQISGWQLRSRHKLYMVKTKDLYSAYCLTGGVQTFHHFVSVCQQRGSCILKCTMPHTGTRTHMGSNEALYSKGKKGRYTRESNQEQLICISGYISGYMVRWSKRKSSILIVSRRDTFRQHVHAFLISGYHNEYPYNLMVSTGVCSSSLMG